MSFAALIAAGCGGAGGGGAGDRGSSGIVGDDGPLAWLPADTWLVASARLDPKQLDTAIETLDRLPAWSLVESFLPADDGTGLRRAALKYVIAQNGHEDGSKAKVTAKDAEAAFGERAGIAAFGTELSKQDDLPPLAIWVEVDDEERANEVVRELSDGKLVERTREGIEYVVGEGGKGSAFLVQDGLLLLAPNAADIRTLIDTHEGDRDTLADDETGRAVIEGGVGDAIAGVAVQSDPLLDAAPEIVKLLAKDADDPADAAKARVIAAKLGPVLKSAAVDGLVADWMSMSVTIDDTGLRVRGAWSNPHELAEPETGSRELVERMPVDARAVSAGVGDGTRLGRVQDAWQEVQGAYDLDLRGLARECAPADRWACSLGAEAALAVLEDEDLAKTAQDMGDRSAAYTQDLGAALAGVLRESKAGATKPPTERVLEVAIAAERWPRWNPPARLEKAASDAGLIVTSNDDQTKVTLRVRPGSPIARAMQRDPESSAALASVYGLDARRLLTSGVTIEAKEVDGIRVAGLPSEADSRIVPALQGDADTIGDDDTYQRVTKAANPPKDVGLYGYIDLRGYVEDLFGSLAADQPELGRVLPTIRNNLADAPGLVIWSGRDEVDGEQVGTWEYVLPILE